MLCDYVGLAFAGHAPAFVLFGVRGQECCSSRDGMGDTRSVFLLSKLRWRGKLYGGICLGATCTVMRGYRGAEGNKWTLSVAARRAPCCWGRLKLVGMFNLHSAPACF